MPFPSPSDVYLSACSKLQTGRAVQVMNAMEMRQGEAWRSGVPDSYGQVAGQPTTQMQAQAHNMGQSALSQHRKQVLPSLRQPCSMLDATEEEAEPAAYDCVMEHAGRTSGLIRGSSEPVCSDVAAAAGERP